MESIRQHETQRREAADACNLGFLPAPLKMRCRALIQSYHEIHGFGSLADILWKSRLEPFIASTPHLNRILRKASTTRSAKKAHDGFTEIASTVLALEILSTNFSGWRSAYPDAGNLAVALFSRDSRRVQSPLMEFYLYPPKYLSAAAITSLSISVSGDSEPPYSYAIPISASRQPHGLLTDI